MPRRPGDRLRQARRNLAAAEALARAGIYEEACFESHQAAEKALRALLQALGVERRGHSLTYLASEARVRGADPPSDVAECLASLDKHYIPARYPTPSRRVRQQTTTLGGTLPSA